MKTTPKAAGLTKKGFTLIELVVALAVSTILGVILVSTVQTGVTSYKNIDKDMMSETQARAALSLVTVQIRQHDTTGAISVIDAQTMKFVDDPSNADSSYSIISFSGVKLTASEYAETSAIAPSSVTQIALLTSFSVTASVDTFGSPVFNFVIGYGEGRVLEQSVAQRSAGGAT